MIFLVLVLINKHTYYGAHCDAFTHILIVLLSKQK